MNILPAIDIRHGKVVQLVGGDPNQVAVSADNTPAQQANAWREAGAKMLHVVDLDGALGEPNQWPRLGQIIATGLPVQFGGGVRSMVDVERLLSLGINRVIIGTQGVNNPDWLREVAGLYPDKVVLAIDAFGRDVAVKGWTEKTGKDVVALAASLDNCNLAGFLYTNVEKEGKMQGIDADVVQELRQATPNTPLIVSGGIHNLANLQTLSDLGVDAVVLGMSIYTGAIDLSEAVAQLEAA